MSSREILEEARAVRAEVEGKYEEGNFEDIKKRLFKPFIKADYQKEKEVMEEGEYKFSFSKTEINDNEKELLLGYLKELKRLYKQEGKFTDLENWHSINQLDYSIGNVEFNIFDLSLSGYKILFCPDSEIKTGKVFYESKIIIAGDIASIGGLSVVLHEKGHVKDKANRINKAMFPQGGTFSENIKAEKLREEREASMYAISKMWRILRNNPQLKSDVLSYLKDMSYFSYYYQTFSELELEKKEKEKDMELINTDIAQDLEINEEEIEELNNFSRWLVFKETPEYVEWKRNDKFIKLNEYDEYGAWKDWIIETGKIDNRQLN